MTVDGVSCWGCCSGFFGVVMVVGVGCFGSCEGIGMGGWRCCGGFRVVSFNFTIKLDSMKKRIEILLCSGVASQTAN